MSKEGLQATGSYRLRKNRQETSFSDLEVIDAKGYLKNPTALGIWCAEARWLFESPIRKDIDATIRSKLQEKFTKKSQGEYYEKRLLLRTESISFYLRLFTQLTQRKDGLGLFDRYADDEDAHIFSMLDLDNLALKYKTALSYFEKNIFIAEAVHKVGQTFLTKFKKGNFICMVAPRHLDGSSERVYEERYGHLRSRKKGGNKIQIVSLTSESLKIVLTFLKKLKLIEDPEYYALFSPEEELLEPYVDILDTMAPYILRKSGDSQFFKKMINDYRDGNYAGCISTAGLIAEGCLTQIYETIYRVPAPRKMTLGGLKQKIGEATTYKDTKELDQQTVAALLLEYRNKYSNDPVRFADQSGKLILRYIDDRYKKLDNKVKVIEGLPQANSLFPSLIKANLEDIIRFRNAVSHRSLDPIGSFEALKSIYCCFSLTMWWDEARKAINWEDTPEGIIKQFVASAVKSS